MSRHIQRIHENYGLDADQAVSDLEMAIRVLRIGCTAAEEESERIKSAKYLIDSYLKLAAHPVGRKETIPEQAVQSEIPKSLANLRLVS